MIHVDWDDMELAHVERARVERRIAGIPIGPKDVLSVRRAIGGYQAILSKSLHGCGTELRVHGDDLVRVIECVRALATTGGSPADAIRRFDVGGLARRRRAVVRGAFATMRAAHE